VTRWPWQQDLIRICEAVQFDDSGGCAFAGRPLTLDGPPDVDDADPDVDLDVAGDACRLRAALSRALYVHCYSRHFTGALPEPSPIHDPDFVPDARFALELSEANQSRCGWDPGWEICHIGVDRDVQVRHGDRYRTVPAGQYAYAAGPGLSPRVGDLVSLQVLRESLQLQAGFYFAFGETLGDQFDEVDRVRFYFHLDPRGAPRLVELLTSTLNRFQIAFELKCQKYRENYDRLDAVVLYVARRYVDLAHRLVREVAAEIQPQLRSAVPLLTKPIHAGIGVADDPGGRRSFGQDRCDLIAAALCDARRNNRIDPGECLRALRRRFERRGASFERPYLNPGRVEWFEPSREAGCAP